MNVDTTQPATTTTTTNSPSAPLPAAAPVTTAPPPPAATWTDGLPDEVKGFIQTKGFKGPQDVIDSYRNYEKLIGVPQERLLKMPEDMNSPEGKALWQRLGTPKEAKDYSITIPKEHGDEKLAEWMRTVAFENGFTTKQVEGLVNKWNERSAQVLSEQKAQHEQAVNQAQVELKSKWAGDFDKNKNLMDQAAASLGWDKNKIAGLASAVGYAGAAQMLVDIANATGEHTFVNANGAPRISTPEQAKSEMSQLMSDRDFVTKWNNGDVDARKKITQLNQILNPGTMTI